MTHARKSGAILWWRRSASEPVAQSAQLTPPSCVVPSHRQSAEDSSTKAARCGPMFQQRTLLVLCAAGTLANSVGCAVALGGGQPLSALAAGGCAFGGAFGFLHEHTD